MKRLALLFFCASFFAVNTAAASGKSCVDTLSNYKSQLALEATWARRNQMILEDLAVRLASSKKNLRSFAIIGGPRSGKTVLMREIQEYLRGGHADRYVEWFADHPELFLSPEELKLLGSGRLSYRSIKKFSNDVEIIDFWRPVELDADFRLLKRLSGSETPVEPKLVLIEMVDQRHVSQILLSRFDVVYDLYDWAQ